MSFEVVRSKVDVTSDSVQQSEGELPPGACGAVRSLHGSPVGRDRTSQSTRTAPDIASRRMRASTGPGKE